MEKPLDVFEEQSQAKPLQEWQKGSSKIYPPIEIDSLASELTEEQEYATRILLINTPGLLQDDIAKSLRINPYTLTIRDDKPEDVELKEEEDSYKLLASTGLGKAILARRQARIDQLKDVSKSFEVLREERLRSEAEKEQEARRQKTANRVAARRKQVKVREQRRQARHMIAGVNGKKSSNRGEERQ